MPEPSPSVAHRKIFLFQHMVPSSNEIKLFERIIKCFRFLFNTEPCLIWNNDVLAAKTFVFHFRRHSRLKLSTKTFKILQNNCILTWNHGLSCVISLKHLSFAAMSHRVTSSSANCPETMTCTAIQASVQAIIQSNGNGQILTLPPRWFQNPWMDFSRTWNNTTMSWVLRVSPCGVTTWVVSANTWLVTHFSFLVYLFLLRSSACAKPTPVDCFDNQYIWRAYKLQPST